jgi:abortive infection bacteriophage resistance protein
MTVYTHKDFEEQVDLLESRNMKFSSEDSKIKAIEKLSIISYYKIKEFARPFAKISKKDGIKYIDYQQTSFEVITTRYFQDKKLRLHLLSAIEDIEVSLKTQVAFVLGSGSSGAYKYLKFKKWCNRERYCKYYLEYRENKFKRTLLNELERNKSPEIDEKLKASESKFPPIWLAINILTFGEVVNLLDLMSKRNLRAVSKFYGCSDDELISWMKCINLIRNMCAHNSNVIDMKLKTTPMIREEWKELLFEMKEGVYSNRVALPIIVIKYMMDALDPNYKFGTIFTAFEKLIKNNDRQAKYYGLKNVEVINILRRESLYTKL